MHTWTTYFRTTALATLGILLIACGPSDRTDTTPLGPVVTERADGLSNDRCLNFQYETQGDLGIHLVPGDEDEAWYGKLGALPQSVVIGELEGTMFSWVDDFYFSGEASGKPMHGGEHLTLHHRFELDDDTWFQTDDRAVCSPSGDGGCLVNDQMRVVAGAGLFADPDGWIKNKGRITFAAGGGPVGGTLELNLRGRVCGDGL